MDLEDDHLSAHPLLIMLLLIILLLPAYQGFIVLGELHVLQMDLVLLLELEVQFPQGVQVYLVYLDLVLVLYKEPLPVPAELIVVAVQEVSADH